MVGRAKNMKVAGFTQNMITHGKVKKREPDSYPPSRFLSLTKLRRQSKQLLTKQPPQVNEGSRPSG